MQTAAEYLTGTASAVRHLFAGIDIYLEFLRIAVNPVFAMSEPFGTAARMGLSKWMKLILAAVIVSSGGAVEPTSFQ